MCFLTVFSCSDLCDREFRIRVQATVTSSPFYTIFPPLPTEQHDPITHVRRARYLTVHVGEPSLSVSLSLSCVDVFRHCRFQMLVRGQMRFFISMSDLYPSSFLHITQRQLCVIAVPLAHDRARSRRLEWTSEASSALENSSVRVSNETDWCLTCRIRSQIMTGAARQPFQFQLLSAAQSNPHLSHVHTLLSRATAVGELVKPRTCDAFMYPDTLLPLLRKVLKSDDDWLFNKLTNVCERMTSTRQNNRARMKSNEKGTMDQTSIHQSATTSTGEPEAAVGCFNRTCTLLVWCSVNGGRFVIEGSTLMSTTCRLRCLSSELHVR